MTVRGLVAHCHVAFASELRDAVAAALSQLVSHAVDVTVEHVSIFRRA